MDYLDINFFGAAANVTAYRVACAENKGVSTPLFSQDLLNPPTV